MIDHWPPRNKSSTKHSRFIGLFFEMKGISLDRRNEWPRIIWSQLIFHRRNGMMTRPNSYSSGDLDSFLWVYSIGISSLDYYFLLMCILFSFLYFHFILFNYSLCVIPSPVIHLSFGVIFLWTRHAIPNSCLLTTDTNNYSSTGHLKWRWLIGYRLTGDRDIADETRLLTEEMNDQKIINDKQRVKRK